MASTVPGSRIIDPNAPGLYGLANALQLSGLTVTRAQAGYPLQVVFTATSIDLGGALYDANDTIMGLATDQNGIVVVILPGVPISVGPFGSAIRANEYEAVNLTSNGPLPTSLGGAVLYVYVGPESLLGAYPVGTSFTPNLDSELQAGTQVQTAPAATTAPTTTAPTTTTGTSPGTTTTGTSTTATNTEQTAPKTGLSTTAKIAIGVGAVGVLAGGAFFLFGSGS